MCEKVSTPNNWAVTQYISKSANMIANMTIFINITVRFGTCTPSCAKLTSVYTILANNSQVSPSISSSSLVGNITTTTTNLFDAGLNFTLKSHETGFYVALCDAGNCPTISRVKVYYYQCPAKQVGLVLFPQTPAPTKSNSPQTVIASCVTGGVNTTSLDLQCDNNGGWKGMPVCVCRLADGYYPGIDGSRCTGMCAVPIASLISLTIFLLPVCGVGYWLDTLSVSCQLCPQNSSSASEATSECPCIAGYYRSPGEGPSIGCTGKICVIN